ncbi:glycoside hydrolase family 2 protein, partial [Snuella lapsa]|uniref:Beta-mannosidase Ig-fold domain-containing protein n=1 Tax=Snuella lapsa TaxID=870481 RepID=A0ABP6XMI9_9FLAO
MTLRAATLVKDLFITVEGASLKLSDNYFDLLPNVPATIVVESKDFDDSKIEIKSLVDAY